LRIRSFDTDLVKRLAALGVSRFDQIAAWTPSDVARVSGALGFKGRIEQENWIEQAQILAKGGETFYSRRYVRGEMPTAREIADEGIAAPRPHPAPVPAGRSGVEAAAAAAAALAAATAGRAAAPTPPAAPSTTAKPAPAAAPIRPAPPPPAPAAAPAVIRPVPGTDASITVPAATVAAAAAAAAAAAKSATAPAAGPSAAPSATASALHQPVSGTAPAAPAPAPATRTTDVAGLRSVRSEALTGESRPARSGAPEDLKRIRGIGVLIEKKLNSLGVFTYDQIARWTQDDIVKVSTALDFKGRIERENWVEQARILASGGQTEFSRRVDRGEVETSRNNK
jgi:predicted flap endonuclease-1-like 5' DNA nuclease